MQHLPIYGAVKGSVSLHLAVHVTRPPCPITQAFVGEVVNVGELRWLEEWKNSKDKKALLTTVPTTRHSNSARISGLISKRSVFIKVVIKLACIAVPTPCVLFLNSALCSRQSIT